MIRASGILGVLVLQLLSALSVSAQTTGSIRGRTVDADGQALPGVTIVVAGEVLGSAQRTAVTSASGGFSFPAMPIGTFKVTATLEGYQTQAAEEVRVAIGKVASVDFSMPGEFSDVVTVTSEAPIIDLASPTFTTNLEFEDVVDLPTRGNFYDVMATTPGITQPNEGSEFINAFGADAKMSQWNIDGVNRTTPGAGYLAWTFNEELVAEYAVVGTGASAEYGQMLGTAFNVVTKSGTNQFHGSAALNYQNPDWVGENAESLQEDTPDEARTYRLDTNDRLSVTLGGPVVRDKLWFFVGAEQGRFNAYSPDQVPGPEPKDDTSDLYDGKITAQLGGSHRLNLTYNDHERLEPAGGSVFAEPTTWTEFTVDTQSYALDYSGILGRNTILEARYGNLSSHEEVKAQTPTDEPHFIDYTVSPTESFGGPYWPWLWDSHMDTGEIKLTQHASDFLKGDHEFRFGIQYNQMGELGEPTGITYSYKYDYYNVLYGTDYYWYEYDYRFVATPHFYGGESETWSAFVADSWKITNDVTLELGVRYDKSKGWIEDLPRLDDDNNPTGEIIPGRDTVAWDYIDPRLGFAWNIGGTGENALRGSVGR
ncbi:MAG: TonB-dependent receptor, partial [bacterium]|nr:TonB-dependent receptor [bacterium]